MKSLEIIIDSSSIIALLSLNLLQYLELLYKKIHIPSQVLKEVSRKGRSRHQLNNLMERATFEKCIIIKKELVELLQADKKLDSGEAEAIVQAKEKRVNTLLIDEEKARKIAQGYEIKVIGILAILCRFKQLQIIPDVKSCIKTLKRKNFRFSPEIESKILQEANELEY